MNTSEEADSWVKYFRLLINKQERKYWELNSQAHQLHGRTFNTTAFVDFSLLPLSTDTDTSVKHTHHNVIVAVPSV